MTRSRSTIVPGAAAAWALSLQLVLACPVGADAGPVRGRPAAGDAAAPTAAPGPSATLAPARLPGTLVSRPTPPLALDKGSFHSDAGHGRDAAEPTPGERAKLDAARAAVEMSRLAGTLIVSRLLPAPALERPDPAALRLKAAVRTPARLPADVAAGVGGDIPSVQKVGPAGLSAIERRKLEELLRPAAPDVTARPAPRGVDGPPFHGDGSGDAAARPRQGGR